MPCEPPPLENAPTLVRTLRLKVKPESYSWLNAAAAEVNLVWNFCNEISARAAPSAGPPKWLSEYELNNLTAGATEYFEHIGSATIQRVNAEFATRHKQFKKIKLRWRVSRGPRRSLGWVPLKTEQLKRNGKGLRFCGKSIRVFEQERLEGRAWNSGCFAQDALGDWWLCLPVEYSIEATVATKEVVGLDLGLRETAATNTTRECSSCHALTGPTGLDMLSVSAWVCSACGVVHDGNVNSAKNTLCALRISARTAVA